MPKVPYVPYRLNSSVSQHFNGTERSYSRESESRSVILLEGGRWKVHKLHISGPLLPVQVSSGILYIWFPKINRIGKYYSLQYIQFRFNRLIYWKLSSFFRLFLGSSRTPSLAWKTMLCFVTQILTIPASVSEGKTVSDTSFIGPYYVAYFYEKETSHNFHCMMYCVIGKTVYCINKSCLR